MTDSIAPPPTSNAIKYGAIGGGLLAIALLLLFCGDGEERRPTPPIAGSLDAGVAPPPLYANEIEIPDEIDMGPADAGTVEDTASNTMRPRGMRSPDCTGTVARPALTAAVRRYRGAVRQCYERALKNNSLLRGRVNVRVRIGASGNVETASASGNLGGAVNSCVRASARGWRLVPPTGGTCAVASVPFNMTPSN